MTDWSICIRGVSVMACEVELPKEQTFCLSQNLIMICKLVPAVIASDQKIHRHRPFVSVYGEVRGALHISRQGTLQDQGASAVT